MVGGMIRRDDVLPSINTANIFSALESRRRKSSKKRSDKEKAFPKVGSAPQPEKPPLQVWTPTPVSVTSWADCEEDDDDYFALPALPPVLDQSAKTAPTDLLDELSEDESDGEDELDDDAEEDNEEEQESETVDEPVHEKIPALSGVQQPTAREPDRQLSKKELKKKELAELDAVLAELGLNTKDEKESTEEGACCESNGAVGQSENLVTGPVLTESKSSKRRKAKKDKSFKGEKEDEVGQETTETLLKEEASIEDIGSETAPADPKEVLKKIASMKKKKSFKESDGAAKAAAAEAAARAARLAAAKKKEKNHYNQQPVR